MSDETQVPYLAPGCFGSALMFRGEDMVCAACPFRAQCEPAHQVNLAAMRERLGIKVPVQRKRAPALPPAEAINEDPSRMSLPKKVRELLSRLDRENLDIVGKIQKGVNPFAGIERYRYMQIACHLIMNMQVPVTQKLIAVGLAKAMDWADGTADAHARMAVQALEHVGAVSNNDGTFSVRR
jgi:hypothetical protein